ETDRGDRETPQNPCLEDRRCRTRELHADPIADRADRHAVPAAERREIPDCVEVGTADDVYLRAIAGRGGGSLLAAAGAGADDDADSPVAVDIARRDADAAGEGRIEGIEAEKLVQVGAAEDADERRPARSRTRNDVGVPVAIHITCGDTRAASEG